MPFTINGTTGINLGTQPLTGSLPDANAPVGSVIQVVHSTVAQAASTTSTSFVSAGQSLSITPTSASNRIVVIFSCVVNITLANTAVGVTVFRNGSMVTGYYALYSGTHSRSLVVPLAVNYVDSPNTTSAVTYDVRFKEGGVPGTAFIGDVQRTLTVMEIAA